MCRCAQQAGHSITETLLSFCDFFPCRSPNRSRRKVEALRVSRFDRTQGEVGALTQPPERSTLPCLGPLVALPPQTPMLTDLSA